MSAQSVVLALSALGGICWLLCAVGNAAVLRAQVRRRPDEPTPSFEPLVGGATGLIARHASFDPLAARADRLDPIGPAGAWLDGFVEWPATMRWLESLATAAQARVLGIPCKAPREHAWPLLLARNLAFLCIVLAHGFRRLLPPW
jgi:hypothetical protein